MATIDPVRAALEAMWAGGTNEPARQQTFAHYLAVRATGEGASNETAILPQHIAHYTAVRQAIDKGLVAGRFEARVAEDDIVPQAGPVTVVYRDKLAVKVADVEAASFTYNPSTAVSIRLTGSFPSNLQTLANAGRVYLRAKRRTVEPKSKGEPAIVPVMVAMQNGQQPVAPPFVQFSSKVQEDVIVPTTPGGTFARRAYVTWPVSEGTQARARKFVTATGDTVSLTDPDATFTGVVEVGDYLEMVPRTSAPTTAFPERVAGHYRVLAVGIQSLSLSPMRYTQAASGEYQPDVQPPFFDERVDFVVRRQLANRLVVVSDAGAPVLPGDFVRVSGSEVYPVASTVPGFLLLTDSRHTGASAPYTAAGASPVGYFETPLAEHLVTRAPAGAMAKFELRDPAGGFVGAAAGDYVAVNARTGTLDATEDPSHVTGLFKILSVPDAATVRLDNVSYSRVDGEYVAGARRYVTFDDVASAAVERQVVSFPNEAVYKVSLINGVGATLDLKRYGGDSGWGGNFFQTGTVTEGFTDAFDVEVLVIHDKALALVGPSWPTGTDGVAATDFVHLVPRVGSTQPTVNRPVVRGAFKGATLARPDVLILNPRAWTGSEPRYQDLGVDFQRSLTHAQRQAFEDVADVRVTRVKDSLAYARLTVSTADAALAAVGDFALVSNGPLLSVGAWKVTGKDGLRLTLEPTTRYRREGDEFIAAPISATQLTGTSAELVARLFSTAPEVTLVRVTATSEPLTGAAVGDVALLEVPDDTAAQGLLSLAHRVTAVGSNFLTLSNTLLTGTDGAYAESSSYPPAKKTNSYLTVVRPTRLKADCEIVANHLRDIVGATLIAPLDAAYGALVPAPVRPTDGGPVAMRSGRVLGLALSMAVSEARDVFGKSDSERTTAKLNKVNVTFSDRLEAVGAQLDIASVAFLKLRDGDPTGAAVLGDYRYHQALAWVALSDFTAVLAKQTVEQLKDAYVHAVLRQRGYDALEAYAIKKEPDLVKREQLAAEASAGRAVAVKVVAGARAALAQRDRASIEPAILQQLENLLAVVKDALKPEYEFPERMFVERIKGADIPFDTDVLTALLSLKLPGYSLGGIKGATPKERRAALGGMIGVPADRSLTAVRRSYALTKNRQRFMDKQIEDMERHRTTALDPTTAETLTDWLARVVGPYTEVETLLDGLAADLNGRGVEPEETGDGSVDPSDVGAVESEYAGSAEAPEGDGVEVFEQSFGNEVGAAVARTTILTTGGIAAAPPRQGAFKGTISNLFENDFHDYKRTGLVVSLNALNASAEGQDKNNLATIFLTDEHDVRTDAITLDVPGRFQGGDYNQFILSGVNKTRADKYQVMDTLSRGWVAFAFGEHPEIWTVSGFLINDLYSDMATKFDELWHHHLRITALAESRRKMAFRVPAAGVTIVGYGLSLQMSVDAGNNESVVPFSMQILVSRTFTEPLITMVKPEFKKVPERITSVTLGSLGRNELSPESAAAGPSGKSPEAVNRQALAAINTKITGAQKFVAKLKADLAKTQPGSTAALKLTNDIRAAENTLAGYKAEKSKLEGAPVQPVIHGAVAPTLKALTDGAARAAATPQRALKTVTKNVESVIRGTLFAKPPDSAN